MVRVFASMFVLLLVLLELVRMVLLVQERMLMVLLALVFVEQMLCLAYIEQVEVEDGLELGAVVLLLRVTVELSVVLMALG